MIVPAIVLLLLALLGAPLFSIIAASALLGFARAEIDLSVMGIEFFGIAEMPILLAIPLFTFAGFVLGEGGAPQRLVRLSRALLGWLPGGLGMLAIVVCALFTAFTGASGVTIIALGALFVPALAHAGYAEKFNLGLITAAGSLGLLFAPSLPLILYGVISEQPIDSLFLAGLLPGTLMIAVLCIYTYYQNRHLRIEYDAASGREIARALFDAKWELPLPVVVLGGIYSGYFAVSEAAAVTTLYVLLVEFVILREIPFSRLTATMRQSMVLVGAIFVILGMSLASTNYMIDIGVPQQLFGLISQYVDSQTGFLIALLLFLLVLGAILDIFSAIVLVVPLMLPVATEFGIDPIHLGIVFLAAMELGYLTPPVGLNLFISSHRFDKDVTEIYWATLPFLLVLFVSVVIIAFWPALSLVFVE